LKGIWKFSDLLPPIEPAYQVTLGEGDTPLVHSKQIGRLLGFENLYFKLEMLNPTGSYKDRFASCAISDMLQKKLTFCFSTSSGNTGSAMSAYCAASGLRCFLVIVDGAPQGKLRQMQVYGSDTIIIREFGKDVNVTKEVIDRITDTALRHHSSVQISSYSHSPVGMAGVQTIAYEIAEAMTDGDVHIFSPAGGGGLTCAILQGFGTWKKNHPQFRLPKIHCVQPIGNDTIASALRNGLSKAIEIHASTTAISGLQVPAVLDGDEVVAGCRESGGNGHIVSDELIYECQEQLASREGIFCEPAGAVSLAGLRKAIANNEINRNATIVCLVTGHGFKDSVSGNKIAEKAGTRYFSDSAAAFASINAEIDDIRLDKANAGFTIDKFVHK
jgi:threonine synthase